MSYPQMLLEKSKSERKLACTIVAKSIFDRIFALTAIIALIPIFLPISLAVKLSSPGPVFFRQKRRGKDGAIFEIFKFRTMRLHAGEEALKQATKNDSRITSIGRILRKTSLDELPQFFNVLRGDMSVVGPRPHAIEHDNYYEKLIETYMFRYKIKPGITGWAQVNGWRGETDSVEKMRKRVEYDLWYIKNISFFWDIKIILLTFLKGWMGKNAY